MTGIIHLPKSTRTSRSLTRRSLMLGGAGYAAATAFGDRAFAQPATPAQGTPVSSPESGGLTGSAQERLIALLQLVPENALGGPDPNSWLFTWLDLQSHLTALGISDLNPDTTDIMPIMSALVSDDPLFQSAALDEARETFGFSAWDAHQTLVAGVSPDQVTFYAGGLPIADLPGIWDAAGYERKTGDAGEYWTVGEDGDVSLSSPVGTLGLGRLNNVAIIDDEIVVFARTAQQLLQVRERAMNDGASAADNDEIARLVESMPADAVNVIAIQGGGLEAQSITPENPGAALNRTTIDLLAESDEAAGPMPPIEMGFFGVTAGIIAPESPSGGGTPTPQGNEDARIFVNLLTGSAEEAAAVAEIVAWRVDNMISPTMGYPYNELLFPGFSGADAAQGDVAALSFIPPESAAFWYQMIAVQDLWPFVWLEEDL